MKLVTGGSGFFGAHLVKKLDEMGEDVTIMDIKRPGQKTKFIMGDVTRQKDVEKAVSGVDTIFHLAALLPQSAVTDAHVYNVNYYGSKNVFEVAKRRNIKVVHISSSSVFGVPVKKIYSENDAKNPIGPYGRSKLDAELLFSDICADGLDAVALRPMTIMGPGIYGLFNRCLNWIKRGYPVPVFGDGKNRLQMVSAEDLAEACICADEKNVSGEIFNIGSDNVPPLRQMFENVIDRVGSSSKIISLPAGLSRKMFIFLRKLKLSPLSPEHYLIMDKNFILDNIKAKKMLKWKPQHDNTDMLVDAYNWLHEKYTKRH